MDLGDRMKAVGIICEYNPFHNGHLYHINKIKELFPTHKIILILSGNFTQRGIVSLLNKWDKTDIALTYGVDLVIELPFVFATQSADLFAKGSIALLKEMQVEYFVFGSESGSIKELTELATIQLEHPEYDKVVSQYLKQGLNYPTALSEALQDLCGKKVTTPNDLLGLSYVKEIKKQHAKIIPITIQRTNDFHSKEMHNHIASATAIRENLQKKNSIKEVVPTGTLSKLKKQLHQVEDYFPFLQYQMISQEKHLKEYQTVDEGIENRIQEFILKSDSYSTLIQNIKTKRYTYNRIMRMLTHILVGFTKEEASRNKEIHYIRILGMNKEGQAYLNKIKKEVQYPIVVACNEIKDEMLQIELRATKIFAMILPPKEKEKLIHKEYQKKPIQKEKKTN